MSACADVAARLSDGQGAEAEVGGQLRYAFFGRETAVQRIVGQARQEARPQPPCRRFPALCGQRYGLHIGQGRHVPAFGGQPRLPCLPGGGIGRRQYFGLTRLLQPGRAVGGEIGRQAVGLHG